MKQLIQSYRTGKLRVVEVPIPACRPGGVLVKNMNSLISPGTEKFGLEIGRKSLFGKARARPDLAKQVWQKVRSEGVLEAYRQVTGRLDTPVSLGYSCAGEVIEVGGGAGNFRIGDRVAGFGSGRAAHAEFVFLPKNLSARIPGRLDFEEAAFAGLGAIALHGTRLLQAGLGETVVIIGLGLLGLLSLQLLKASGVRVIGMDPDEWRLGIARQTGADEACGEEEETRQKVREFTAGQGADAVIIWAATRSNQPLELAARVARKQGVIAVPGLVGLQVPRSIFYQKELRLMVPRSAGPGIYDIEYEERGRDYPAEYVRWTARRNLEAFLELAAQKKVDVSKLITNRFPLAEADQAYSLLTATKPPPHLAILLQYPGSERRGKKILLPRVQEPEGRKRTKLGVGLIGAGLFARGTLLPLLKRTAGINLKGVATATGASGDHAGKKFDFEYCTTDYREILHDPEVDCLIIATRHHLHAPLVVEALENGKHILVEKPLALSFEELRQIIAAYQKSTSRLMVGYNRRFSPFSQWIQKWLGGIKGPWVINCRINAGYVPPESWVQDPQEGGGRIIGEVGHFIDLIEFLTGSLPQRVFASSVSSGRADLREEDNIAVNLQMQDGSTAAITYTAGGDKAFPRERLEIFGGGAVGVIDNFKSSFFSRSGKTRKMQRLNVDRGHKGELQAFIHSIRSDSPLPVDIKEYIYTTVATFQIRESLQKGVAREVDIAEIENAQG